MARDSWGEIGNQVRSPALLRKPGPLARSKKDPTTFSKPDGYALVARLAAQWPFLLSEVGRDDVLAHEFCAQLDGFEVDLVDRAVTAAIGKAVKGPPSVGQIKAELRTITTPPSETRHKLRTEYDYSNLPERISSQDWARKLMHQGCHPGYIVWREKDRALTREAVEKMDAMTPEQMRKLGIDAEAHSKAKEILSGKYDRHSGPEILARPAWAEAPIEARPLTEEECDSLLRLKSEQAA